MSKAVNVRDLAKSKRSIARTGIETKAKAEEKKALDAKAAAKVKAEASTKVK